MKISAVRSNLSREAALQKLTPHGLPGLVRGWFTGKLRALADVYVPYRLYEVTVADRGIEKTRYYAIDAATGDLDPYEFQAPPDSEIFVELDIRNSHPVRLEESQTHQLAIEKVRRSMFSGGSFRLRNPVITAHVLHEGFYIPYWAAFFGDEQNLTVAVLNAVRQTMEGSKLRQLLRNWLLQSPDSQEQDKDTAKPPHLYADAYSAES